MNIRKKMKVRVRVNSVSIKRLISFLLCISVITSIAHAHEDILHKEAVSIWHVLNLPEPLDLVYIGSAVALVSLIISLFYEKKLDDSQKKGLFFLIAISIIIPTIYLAGTTVYLNIISETGGPVHWHADFEIWACEKQQELRDPQGLDNKIGTPVFHEHNDNRMHVEGVVYKLTDLRLEKFFEVIGGKLTEEELVIPVNDNELKSWKNGNLCDGKKAKLQVFVYSIINAHPDQKTGFLYKQEKLENFEDYVLSHYSLVPPGDCIIIEFGEEKNKTEKICTTYKILIEKGEMEEA